MDSNLKKLVISSRARFYKKDNLYMFQSNDGKYINEISDFFKSVIVFAGEVYREDVYNETLQLNSNIVCYNKNKLLKKNLWRLLKIVKSADIVYVFYPLKYSLIIAFIAFIFKKKIIAYNGGVWNQMKTLKKRSQFINISVSKYFEFLEYISIILSNIYIVNNNILYNKYHQRYKLIKTIPFISFIHKDKYYRANTCNKKQINLLSVNHIKEGKNIIELLESFKLLINNNLEYEFTLSIVGKYNVSEPYAKSVESFVNKEHLDSRIRFTGVINDDKMLLNYYRQSDILLLLSDSEGFPRVVWEAFSQSLPVVCSSLPNIVMEFVGEPLAVCFLKENTPSSVYDSVIKIINDNSYNSSLIRNGNKLYDNKFNKTPKKQFEEIINTI